MDLISDLREQLVALDDAVESRVDVDERLGELEQTIAQIAKGEAYRDVSRALGLAARQLRSLAAYGHEDAAKRLSEAALRLTDARSRLTERAARLATESDALALSHQVLDVLKAAFPEPIQPSQLAVQFEVDRSQISRALSRLLGDRLVVQTDGPPGSDRRSRWYCSSESSMSGIVLPIERVKKLLIGVEERLEHSTSQRDVETALLAYAAETPDVAIDADQVRFAVQPGASRDS